MPDTPAHLDLDPSGTPFDALVLIPMLKDRFPDLLDNYGWMVRAGDRVAVVDCARAAPHLDAAAARGWSITDVWLTHHHPDHVAGVADLVAVTGARVLGAAADAHRLPPLDLEVADGDAVALGPAEARVWDVSGHTIGHVAYIFGGVAFTGDSLMAGGCGRLFEGTPAGMRESLARFDALPGETLIASGHEYTATNMAFAASLEPGNPEVISRRAQVDGLRARGAASVPSTLAVERRTNPFLRAHDPALKRATGTSGASDDATFAAARAARDDF
jgi:hydroxyacylglutathione hydrolase